MQRRCKFLCGLAILGLTSICSAQPGNDTCAGAFPIVTNGVPVPFDVELALTDNASTCTPSGERDIWYTYTAPLNFNGVLVVDTSIAAIISFYNACPATLNDLSTQISCFNATRGHVFVTPGSTYLIRLAMPAADNVGTVAFTTRLPGNDNCDIPAVIIPNTLNATHVDFTFADTSGTSTCTPTGERDVWFQFQTFTSPTRLFIDPSDTFAQTVISLYTSCPANASDTSTQAACSTSTNGSVVLFDLAPSQTYRIRFALGAFQSFGALQFWTRPPNDNCADAVPAVLGTAMTLDGTRATKDGAGSCGGDRDVWYAYTASANATLEVRPPGVVAVPRISLYSACPANPTDTSNEIACLGTSGGGNIVSFPVNNGQSYLIRYSTDDGGSWGGGIIFNQLTPPANNTCSAGAPALTTGVGQTFNFAGATGDNTTTCGPSSWDIWFTYTPAFTGIAAAAIPASHGVAAFTSCPLSPTDISTEIDCVSFTSALQLTFAVNSGQTYYIRVSRGTATTTAGGTITMSQQSPTPGNNDCGSPIALTPGGGATNFTLVGATRDGAITGSGNIRGTPDLWYSFTPVSDIGATVTIGGTIAGSASAPTIGVFTACPANPSDTSTEVASISATGVPGRQVTFAATGGQQYLIRVARRNGGTTHIAAGTIALTTFTPAANDTCEGATPVAGGDNSVSTATVLIEDDLPSTCPAMRDAWYYYDVPSGIVGVTIENIISTGASTITLYSSCTGPEVLCSSANFTHGVCLPVAAGQRYYIRVTRPAFSSTAALTQTFTLRISEFTTVPGNGTCASVQVVSEGTHTWGNQGGCREITTCGPGDDVWFQYNPSSSGAARAFIVSATGTISRHLTCGGPAVQCDDNTLLPPFVNVTITFPTTVGTPVYLRLAGTTVPLGAGELTIETAFPPSNDECDQALPIDTGFTFFDTTDATHSGIVDSCGFTGGKDLWFSYTPPRSGVVIFDTCRNAFTDSTGSYPAFSPTIWAISNISVFSACGVSLQCSNDTDPNHPDTCGPAEPFRYHRLTFGPFFGSPTLLVRVGTNIEGAGTGRLYVKYDPTLCVGDFNNNGATTVQDLFDFLTAYFASDPTADINQSGAISVQDIFDYLAAFFSGCP